MRAGLSSGRTNALASRWKGLIPMFDRNRTIPPSRPLSYRTITRSGGQGWPKATASGGAARVLDGREHDGAAESVGTAS